MASLPFLRLHPSVQKLAIELLHPFEQLALSVCSKKSKSAVKNAKIRPIRLHVVFEEFFSIKLLFPNSVFRLRFPNAAARAIQPQPAVRLCYQGTTNRTICRNLSLDYEFWVKHLLSVYDIPNNTVCRLNWTREPYNMEEVQRCLENVQFFSIRFGDALTEQSFGELMTSKIIPPCLSFGPNTYQNEILLRKTLSQNFDCLDVRGYFPEYFSSLNNILDINSHVIIIHGSNFTDKSLNQFLKLWMAGSMPRLECLRFIFDRIIDRNVVMAGIRHTAIRERGSRSVQVRTINGFETTFLCGGLAIRRRDGVSARMFLANNLTRHFCFFVMN